MRSGLLTLGLILFVLGALFSFLPPGEGADVPEVQRELARASLILGGLLILLGLALSDPEGPQHPEQALVSPARPEAVEHPRTHRRIQIKKRS